MGKIKLGKHPMNIFYQSFLLRIWKTASMDEVHWHASLEDPHTRQVTSFQEPEALFRFLQEVSGLSEDTEIKGSQ